MSSSVAFFFYILSVRLDVPYGQHFKYQTFVLFAHVLETPFSLPEIFIIFGRVDVFFATLRFVVIFHIQHLVAFKCQQQWIMQTCILWMPYKSVAFRTHSLTSKDSNVHILFSSLDWVIKTSDDWVKQKFDFVSMFFWKSASNLYWLDATISSIQIYLC